MREIPSKIKTRERKLKYIQKSKTARTTIKDLSKNVKNLSKVI